MSPRTSESKDNPIPVEPVCGACALNSAALLLLLQLPLLTLVLLLLLWMPSLANAAQFDSSACISAFPMPPSTSPIISSAFRLLTRNDDIG